MGLDLALGVFILLAAIRGWLKGFLLQAIRLTGLVACVYAADPVRDLAKPYVLPHLPSMRPELVDRLLWWSAAAIAYVVLVGFATLILKFSRRQAFGLAEPRRNDQYAGFALGAVKGLIVAMFLVAGLERYALDRIKGIGWAEEQLASSKVLKWNSQYQPGMRLWSSTPVQHYVNHVQQMGLKTPERSSERAESKPLQAASGHPPRLLLPSVPGQGIDPSEFDAELAGAVASIKKMLSRVPLPSAPPAPWGK